MGMYNKYLPSAAKADPVTSYRTAMQKKASSDDWYTNLCNYAGDETAKAREWLKKKKETVPGGFSGSGTQFGRDTFLGK